MAKNVKQANITLIIGAAFLTLWLIFSAPAWMYIFPIGFLGYGIYYKFISK